ncbi:MAG: Response regulator MprA [bacterium ADurb.BinA186]|nr:MAG: Response regulator MprA [bacterium ADurb.BinA186]
MKKHHNSNSTILVCDDEKYVRESLHDYLARQGYNVVLAADGVECVEQSKKIKPDLILLDIVMPKTDGINVIRQLRKTQPDIPILVLSASHELGPHVEVEELSLGQFIPKPIRLSEIEYLLETALLEVEDAKKTCQQKKLT